MAIPLPLTTNFVTKWVFNVCISYICIKVQCHKLQFHEKTDLLSYAVDLVADAEPIEMNIKPISIIELTNITNKEPSELINSMADDQDVYH